MWRSGMETQRKERANRSPSLYLLGTSGIQSLPSLLDIIHTKSLDTVLEIRLPSLTATQAEYCTVVTVLLDLFIFSSYCRSLYHNLSIKVDPEPIPSPPPPPSPPYPSFVPAWCLTPVRGQQGLLTLITRRASIAGSNSNI